MLSEVFMQFVLSVLFYFIEFMFFVCDLGVWKKGWGVLRGVMFFILFVVGFVFVVDIVIVQERFVVVDVLMGWS